MADQHPSIPVQAIRKAAAELARQWLPILRARPIPLPAELNDKKALAAALTPAVAAFVGRLTTIAPEQMATLASVLVTFFADAAAIALLERYAAEEWSVTGEWNLSEAIYEHLRAAGLQDEPIGRYYLNIALDSFLATADAALKQVVPGSGFSFGNASGFIFPEQIDEMTPFAAAVIAGELDHMELGQAVAAGGVVIFQWNPAPMAGAGPPEELAEGPPVDEEDGKGAGPEEEEMTGAEPPAEAAGSDPDAGDRGDEPGPDEALHEANGGRPPAANGGGTPPKPHRPAPAPDGESLVDLRLDAALPEHVVVGRAFDLAVAVRQPSSPPPALDDLARQESAGFAAAWPSGAAFIRLRVQISAPECDIAGEDSHDVRLAAGDDAPPVYFQLTPRRAGPLSVIITVYQATDWIGSTRLRTEADDEEPRGKLAITVESRPLGNGEVNLMRLREALDDGYNDSELRDLCFELGIDYEDLPGDGQSAKARELVLYARRRNLMAQLVALVMRDQPHLLVTSDE